MANIVLVDDHILLRNGLANLVKEIGYSVLFEANNGKDFIEKLNPRLLPDIVMLDINMPDMDGYETAFWIKRNHPKIKVLALSMYDDENAIIRMLKNGAKGYILKDSEPAELAAALSALCNNGFYYSEVVTGKLIHAVNNGQEDSIPNLLNKLTDKEMEFLKHACSELTYKEIADKMCLSPRTIDGYRDSLFLKLQLKTRVGLVMFSIKHGIAQL